MTNWEAGRRFIEEAVEEEPSEDNLSVLNLTGMKATDRFIREVLDLKYSPC